MGSLCGISRADADDVGNEKSIGYYSAIGRCEYARGPLAMLMSAAVQETRRRFASASGIWPSYHFVLIIFVGAANEELTFREVCLMWRG